MSEPTVTTYQPTGAPAGGGGRAGAWARTHKAEAGGLAAAALVGGYALYKRHQANAGAAAASTTDPALTTTTDPTAGTDGIAGLTGGGTDLTSLQDEITALQQELSAPAAPAAPTPGPTAPKPGSALYKIKRGDTLAKIATVTLGSSSGTAVYAIRVANPILMPYPRTASLDWLAGDTIRIPKLPTKPKAPVPTPVHPAPPIRRAAGT